MRKSAPGALSRPGAYFFNVLGPPALIRDPALFQTPALFHANAVNIQILL